MAYLFDEVIILDKGKVVIQEEFESLTNKGAKIIGNTTLVDEFVESMHQIHMEQLGETR
ncbi:ABC transporter, partial [Pseudomonas sp. 2822-17]